MKPSAKTLSIQEASQASPSLARLSELTRESKARLQAIAPLLPAAMCQGIQAGPIAGSEWCLLVANNSMAAKLRQYVPDMQTRLQQLGWDVQCIRFKIQN